MRKSSGEKRPSSAGASTPVSVYPLPKSQSLLSRSDANSGHSA